MDIGVFFNICCFRYIVCPQKTTAWECAAFCGATLAMDASKTWMASNPVKHMKLLLLLIVLVFLLNSILVAVQI